MTASDSEPVVIAEIAVGQEILRVESKEWKGRTIFSAWRFWRNGADELRPGKHGLSFAVDRLPVIAAAFNAALEKAHDLGLISGDGD